MLLGSVLGAKPVLLPLNDCWERSRSFARASPQHYWVAGTGGSGGALENGLEVPFTGSACFWQNDHKRINTKLDDVCRGQGGG